MFSLRIQKGIKFPKNKVILFMVLMLGCFIIAQLASLSIFGTKGETISNIRAQQQDLILQNEILKSDINKLQSLSRIEKVAKEVYGMEEAKKILYIKGDEYISMDINED